MAKHTVRQGECISSIAFERGFFWETVWKHPENSKLKQERKDPNVLKPGDEVFVPEKEEKQESCPCEKRHRFRKKGVPAILRLRLMEEPQRDEQQSRAGPPQYPPPQDLQDEDPQEQAEEVDDKPRANVPYVVTIDGENTEGQTDSEGMLEVSIPPNASSGELVIEPGTPQEATIPIRLGYLEPIDTVTGVKQRLANLTFDCGDTTDEENQDYADSIRAFQRQYGIQDSGEIDDQTREKLWEIHGDRQ